MTCICKWKAREIWEKGAPVLALVSSRFIFADPTISQSGAGLTVAFSDQETPIKKERRRRKTKEEDLVLLYKHQWNIRWAFARKHDTFTCENNMLSSHVKRSRLLWLHDKPRLLQQKAVKGKWFGISLFVYIINRTLHGDLEIWNFSSRVEKIFHSIAALTREILLTFRRDISYLRAAM